MNIEQFSQEVRVELDKINQSIDVPSEAYELVEDYSRLEDYTNMTPTACAELISSLAQIGAI